MRPLPLSVRELDVLELTAAGLTQQQIAAELAVAYDTIPRVLNRVRIALGADSTAHAVALGYVRGLLGRAA